MQQVPQTNCVQKARNKFQEQNQFIEEKYQQATSFTNKNQHARSSKNNISFKRRRISMQQVSQTIVITQQVQWIKSISWGEKSMCKFHEKTNQRATYFTNKHQHLKSSQKKNQHLTSSMHEISFTKRKIQLQVSRRKNQHAISFPNKNQNAPCSTNKISTQQVPWTKSVSRREKSIYKFHEEQNEHVTSSMSEIQRLISWTDETQHAASSLSIISFQRKKTAYKFHEEKN